MNFKIHNKLIQKANSPKSLLCRMIVLYTCCIVVFIFFFSLLDDNTASIDLYSLINFVTVILLTWFIRKSFNILSQGRHLAMFRIGLFLLLNSTLFSMAGGLAVIDGKTTSFIAAILYAPAIILIMISLGKFIDYVNINYRSAINLALTDELTGLPNKRYLNIILREIEKRSGTICIADIDHFKRINDTYGHETGDKVLRNAGLIMSKLTNDDIFISRSGGEEFVIVIFDNINAVDIVRKIKSSVSDGCHESISVTLSVGVSTKQKNDSSSSIINAADDALYRAKRAGRDCIMYAS